MQSTPKIDYLNILQWLLGGGFLASFFGYFWNKYFRTRPKIVGILSGGGSTQSDEGPDRYRFIWYKKLILHNDSVHKARRIKLILSDYPSHWKFKDHPPEILEPDAKVEWSFDVSKTDLRDSIVQLCGQDALAQHRLAEAYLPHVMGNGNLIFSYDSEKDSTFYTVVRINNGKASSTSHWRKPKLSKPSVKP